MKAESLAEQVLRARTETMILELEAIALRLFEESGFTNVTVDDIASEAGISARTFYRYFPTKEDVLLVRIDRRAVALRAALAERPVDEPLLHSVHMALEKAISAEDAELLRHWIIVTQATPGVLRTVLGGNLLMINQSIADFFASRLGVPNDALVPTVLASAVGADAVPGLCDPRLRAALEPRGRGCHGQPDDTEVQGVDRLLTPRSVGSGVAQRGPRRRPAGTYCPGRSVP